MEEGTGPTYPQLRQLSVTLCGTSDLDLLHCCCLCPGLTSLTVVVSVKPSSQVQSGDLSLVEIIEILCSHWMIS